MADKDIAEELSTQFSATFKEKWLQDEGFSLYLNELCGYGLAELSHEPERLHEDRQRILQQTQELAFHNYKTFVETAECSKEIFQDFSEIERHVESLLGRLPVFREKCEAFEKSAHEIAVSRKSNSVLLTHHTKLLEILEIPQLMDTCVRNGYYEEALELMSYVKQMERKHAGLAIIQSIVGDVTRSGQLMLTQLLQQLRTSIQLPACLKLIGYLRRLDVFSETELRVRFLQARDAWFQGKLNEIAVEDSYYHIEKTIELSRVHLFDIITQYRAIFSDDESIAHSQSHLSERSLSQPGLLQSWVIQKVSMFLSVLEWDLHRGVGNRLDSLLGQCMYFGLSLGRVGADFRSLAAPLFQEVALRSFTETIKSAVERFETSMKSYTPASSVVGISSTLSSSVLPLSPPNSISEHALLARLTNTLLTAFNDLRQCAPIGISPSVISCTRECLMSVVQCVSYYHRSQQSALDSSEKTVVESLCCCVKQSFVPFIVRCMESLYPRDVVLSIVGYETQTIDKQLEERLNIQLKIDDIVSPLLDIVPNEDSEVRDESIVNIIQIRGSRDNSQLVGELESDPVPSEGGVVSTEYANSGPLADKSPLQPASRELQSTKVDGKGQVFEEVAEKQSIRIQTKFTDTQTNMTAIKEAQRSPADSAAYLIGSDTKESLVIEET